MLIKLPWIRLSLFSFTSIPPHPHGCTEGYIPERCMTSLRELQSFSDIVKMTSPNSIIPYPNNEVLLSLHCTILCNVLYKQVHLLAFFLVLQKADLHLAVFFHFLMAMLSLNTLHLKKNMFVYIFTMQREALPQTSLLTYFFYSIQWHQTTWVLSTGVILLSRNLKDVLPPGKPGVVVGFGTHMKRSSSCQSRTELRSTMTSNFKNENVHLSFGNIQRPQSLTGLTQYPVMNKHTLTKAPVPKQPAA